MRGWLLAAALALTISGQAHADGHGNAITGVIQSQIDAFLQDDFARAFTFASPGIRSIFGSPERFGQMVRQGYPMVWRPADVQYLELENVNGRTWQKVMITDASGTVHVLGYQMVETDDGWQINGVQLLEAPQIGA